MKEPTFPRRPIDQLVGPYTTYEPFRSRTELKKMLLTRDALWFKAMATIWFALNLGARRLSYGHMS